MIRYELKKLLRGRAAILLAALLALNVFLVTRLRAPGVGWGFDADDVRTLFAAAEGMEPQQAAARLERLEEQLIDAFWSGGYSGQLITGTVDGDRGLVGAVLPRVRETAGYSAYLENVLATQAHLLTLPVYEDPRSFGRRNLLVSGEVYRRLLGVAPRLCYTGMAESLPGGRVTDVILLLAALLTALTLFSGEQKHRTLLLPLKRGRGPLFAAKLAAGGLTLALSAILLYGGNLLIGLLRCGMTPLDAPIQTIYGFPRSPWHITVVAYYSLFLLAKLLSAWSVFGVLALACSALRTPVGAAGLGLGLLFAAAQPEYAQSPVLRACGLLRLCDTERLFQTYANLDLLGRPVPDGLFTLGLWLSVGTLCLAGAAALWRLRSPVAAERPRRRSLTRRRRAGTLFSYEARKLLIPERAILVLLALLLLQLWTYRGFAEHLSPEQFLYLDYAARLQGAPDEEKDAFLSRRQETYDEVRSRLAQLGEDAASGQISPEEHQIRAAALQQQLYGEELLHQVQAQYEQAKRSGGEFVSLLGWERLFGTRGKRELLELGIRLCLALSLGLASIYAFETETGVSQLLGCAARKARSRRYKRLLALGYAAAAFAAAVAPYLLAVSGVYGLDGLDAPAASVPMLFVRFGTVGTAFSLCAAAGLLLTAGAAAAVCVFSSRLRTGTAALIAANACLLPPLVLARLLL